MNRFGLFFLVFGINQLFSYQISACEFGNGLQRGSHTASLMSLDGLQKALDGIRSLEMNSNELGRSQLNSAGDLLEKAASAMTQSLKSAAPIARKIDQEKLDPTARNLLSQISQEFGRKFPLDTNELYLEFIDLTEYLATTIHSSVKSAGPIYPRIAGTMGDYLKFAGLVTQINSVDVQLKCDD